MSKFAKVYLMVAALTAVFGVLSSVFANQTNWENSKFIARFIPDGVQISAERVDVSEAIEISEPFDSLHIQWVDDDIHVTTRAGLNLPRLRVEGRIPKHMGKYWGYEVSNGTLRVFMEPKDKINIAVTRNGLTWEGPELELIVELPEKSPKNLRIEAVSGDINVEGDFGIVDVDMVSGDITTSGDMSEARLSSVSGDIELALPGSKSWNFAFETLSGEISNDFTDSISTSPHTIKIETISGDIVIGRLRSK